MTHDSITKVIVNDRINITSCHFKILTCLYNVRRDNNRGEQTLYFI